VSKDAARDTSRAEWPTPRCVLDIRPDVEADGEPFLRVLAAAEATEQGESFVVIAPFELLAIYSVLSSRGFVYETEHLGPREWLTRFTHLHTPISSLLLPTR
jgi:hypothetical protein